ncbi:MAG TPA: hypothetical protein VJY35_08485 [Candidatus Eisenbacteria bacterium]|nr:hypothetical protein [Candidatus Eisenbacteria bacterium]
MKHRMIGTMVMLGVALSVAPAFAQDRVAELERKVDVLTEEIEKMRLGAVADTTAYAARLGFAPAASKVYAKGRGVSIGGYGEMLAERQDRERQDGTPSGGIERIDFLRAIVYVGHKFNDELLFNSELEWEHSGVRDEAEVSVDTGTGEGSAELTGEATLEFAYLDWSRRRSFGVRAGKLLTPVGLINEQHEPPVFNGARRSETERRIIPTTWSGNGVGVFGELENGLAYRAYVIEGLNAEHFDAANAIRGGRQAGSQSLLRHPAFVARLDWTSATGLLVGGSAFTGNAAQTGATFSPTVTLLEAHARYQRNGVDARGLFVRGTLNDASLLSDALGLIGSDRLGESFFGGYVEVAYDVAQQISAGARYGLAPYLRYEVNDTQEDVPGPGLEDPAQRHRILTAGLAFRPDPNVVVKLDREQRRDDARTGTSQWNAAVGYLF